MKNGLFILLGCLFVAMIGFGVTLPVLPFYVERLALSGGASRETAALHVGLLTAVYPLAQFFFAPLWGRRSDRLGRRPLLLAGIAGFAAAQVLFGLASSLWLLYAARIFGGILSAAMFPVAGAFVADVTNQNERARGMAWFGTATSLGVVVGPALGGMLAHREWHFDFRFRHFAADSFSIPFFAAAFLGLAAFLAALRWLPESLLSNRAAAVETKQNGENFDWRGLWRGLVPLLALSFLAQLALALFETTFPLYARETFNYGPVEVGAVFVVCALVMTVFQAGAVGFLGGRVSEVYQIGAGFALMGTSLALLSTARSTATVFAFVGLLALGMAFIAPNLAALVSKRGGEKAGGALGIQTAAINLGQAGGPALGGALFVWQMDSLYLSSGALLIVPAAFIIARRAFRKTRGE